MAGDHQTVRRRTYGVPVNGAQPSEFDPSNFFGATAMRDVCIARYEAFGAAGNASRIKPISLEAMYQRYLKGELSARVS